MKKLFELNGCGFCAISVLICGTLLCGVALFIPIGYYAFAGFRARLDLAQKPQPASYFTCLNFPPSTFQMTYGDSFTSPLASNCTCPKAQVASLARIAAVTALPSVVPAF